MQLKALLHPKDASLTCLVTSRVKVLKGREQAARAAQQLQANQLRTQLGAARTRAEAAERRESEREAAQRAELLQRPRRWAT